MAPKRGALEAIERVTGRFYRVARQLRVRHAERATLDVTDEYDVQDLLHALLHLEFDDIRAEEWAPSYLGGSSRIDFLLKAEATVIEVKKSRSGLGDREIGGELAIDVARYRAHPDARTLVWLIYDPDGRLANPAGLKRDLAGLSSDQLRVVVHVSPE